MIAGTIFDIRKHAIHDGPGIRTAVFLKGCPLQCLWCHNPEGISPVPELLFRPSRCIDCVRCLAACPLGLDPRREAHSPQSAAIELPEASSQPPSTHGHPCAQTNTDTSCGKPPQSPKCASCPNYGVCAAACPSEALQRIGQTMDVEGLVAIVRQDEAFYRASGGGVTFTGGEPLGQSAFLIATLEACTALGIHCAVETSAFAPRQRFLEVARRADLLLVDLKHGLDDEHRHLTGVPLEPILTAIHEAAGLRALERKHMPGFEHSYIPEPEHEHNPEQTCMKPLGQNPQSEGTTRPPAPMIFRIPLIPGHNDSEASLAATADFIASLPQAPGERPEAHILPYHDAARGKYAARGIAYTLDTLAPPGADLAARSASIFATRGIRTRIGG